MCCLPGCVPLQDEELQHVREQVIHTYRTGRPAPQREWGVGWRTWSVGARQPAAATALVDPMADSS
jgi:hypothetical protein